MNIMTTGGDAEARVSSKGKLTVSGSPCGGQRLEPASHDREKHHILTEGTVYDFLVALNVTDSDGRVFDRCRARDGFTSSTSAAGRAISPSPHTGT
ncbi:MAG: hypothetical protein PUB64_04175 [Firmicutes bacterium]|nr:hypothetical protein [Bacillota bacterium]